MPRIVLCRCSCLDFLKMVSTGDADLVLTDPPYDISKETGFSNGKETGRDVDRFRISMDFGHWDHGCECLEPAVKESFRILRKGGSIVCFYDVWKITVLKSIMEQAGFSQMRLIQWNKTNPVPINSKINYLTNAKEYAVTGVKGGRPVFHSEYDSGMYSHPICHAKDRFHPTQKPLALIKELLAKHSDPDSLVVDCFSGSGTTAHACFESGRRFAGCELDEGYWQKSVERLRNAGACMEIGDWNGLQAAVSKDDAFML